MELNIYKTVVIPAGGTSGNCDLILTQDGAYDILAKVLAGADEATSATSTVVLDTRVPGTPLNYKREKVSACENKITFTAVSDGGNTVKVVLFRST